MQKYSHISEKLQFSCCDILFSCPCRESIRVFINISASHIYKQSLINTIICGAVSLYVMHIPDDPGTAAQ